MQFWATGPHEIQSDSINFMMSTPFIYLLNLLSDIYYHNINGQCHHTDHGPTTHIGALAMGP
jgi:hypothetical protein